MSDLTPPADLVAHAAFVRRLAGHLLRGDADADDAAQETIVRALRRPPRRTGVRSWLAAAQIGLVLLIGLSAKNAILIVEFARRRCAEGAALLDATLEAARLRFRPILMTSFAFILGVLPLVRASGAGAEARRVIGVTVFAGLLAATILGVMLVPVLFVAIERLVRRGRSSPREAAVPANAAHAPPDRPAEDV